MLKDALNDLDAVMKSLSEDDTPEVVEVTPEGFIRHMAKNLEAIKTESGATRIARLKYLGECIAIAKNFEGPTDGSMALPLFRDPAQYPTTDTSGGVTDPKGVATQSAETSHGDAQHPNGTPTPPPGGDMPPNEAPASGNPFAGGNFAKSLDGLTKAIEALLQKAEGEEKEEGEASDEAPATEAKDASQEDTKPEIEAEASSDESVEKAAPSFDVFPEDMNDEDPQIDEETFFGFDAGSPLQKRYEEAKSAPAK